jgi:hypothetical protein
MQAQHQLDKLEAPPSDRYGLDSVLARRPVGDDGNWYEALCDTWFHVASVPTLCGHPQGALAVGIVGILGIVGITVGCEWDAWQDP